MQIVRHGDHKTKRKFEPYHYMDKIAPSKIVWRHFSNILEIFCQCCVLESNITIFLTLHQKWSFPLRISSFCVALDNITATVTTTNNDKWESLWNSNIYYLPHAEILYCCSYIELCDYQYLHYVIFIDWHVIIIFTKTFVNNYHVELIFTLSIWQK